MDGSAMILESLEIAGKVLEALRMSPGLNGAPAMEELAGALESLEAVKKKAVLRTKKGATMAFPLKDAAEQLEEAWQEAVDGGNPHDLSVMVAQFVNNADALVESLKKKTVTLT